MMTIIRDIATLESHYGSPKAPSLVKVAKRMTREYAAWIEASPFCALATVGPDGLDVSPRGDAGPVVRILDDTTLAMPDRRGNDRIDSLRNIVRDPRVSVMFLIPGSGTVIRVIGQGVVSVEPDLLESFLMDGKAPRSVVLVTIDELYFQCARAVMRAGLWEQDHRVDSETLPTPGAILAAMTKGEVGGPDYDAAWPVRARESLW